ncbi:MAG: EAL domain-containing protein [Marinobacter sp.]|nr:EAL domain-containing protein [Marinobacter sp.]
MPLTQYFYNKNKRYLLHSTLLAISVLLLAAWASPSYGKAAPGMQISYLAEPRGTVYDLAQVMAQPDEAWQPGDADFNKGYDRTAYWLKIELTPTSRELFLEIGYPLLDYVDFYLLQAGEVSAHYATGDRRPFDSRPIHHRLMVFPVAVADMSTPPTLILRVQSDGTLQVPLRLWLPQEFHVASDRTTALIHLFYGILLVMAAFNLILFFSLRERAYLYYVLVVGSVLTMMVTLHGVSFQYFSPNRPGFEHQLQVFIIPFLQYVLLVFTSHFLQTRNLYPRLHKVLKALIILSLVCVAGSLLLPFWLSIRLSVASGILVALINIIASAYIWGRSDTSIRIFTAAWLALIFGALGTLLHAVGLLPTSLLTQHSVPLGATVQAVIFAFALADRFHREREARLQEKQASYEAFKSRKEAESQLYRVASHNPLTRLPNRALFEAAVDHLLKAQPDRLVAAFLLHLRQFDDVNKTLGHQQADLLLKDYADRLNQLIQPLRHAVPLEVSENRKSVAHVEGVTFAFLLQGSDKTELFREAEQVTEAFSAPVEFRGLLLEPAFVAGCSFSDKRDSDGQTLLRQAFIAMDHSSMGVRNIAIYNPEMNPYNPRRLTLMTDLREAIRTDGLALHFQPQIHLGQGCVTGFEALLRWFHSEHGFISPDEFIPMAEQSGLMKPLTHWVLKQALAFCHQLDEVNCDALVSVNISALNLREPGFSDDIWELLEDNQVAAQRLALELTETAAMLDPKRSLAALHTLSSRAVRLSIDDFGTGHSSLAYIRKLPVNEIKIDRSFIMEMDRNEGDATIVRTTVNMCHDLGYEVVAEGVENEGILQQLKGLGCDFVQGYHIARPMSAADAIAWLKTTQWKTRRNGQPAPSIP